MKTGAKIFLAANLAIAVPCFSGGLVGATGEKLSNGEKMAWFAMGYEIKSAYYPNHAFSWPKTGGVVNTRLDFKILDSNMKLSNAGNLPANLANAQADLLSTDINGTFEKFGIHQNTAASQISGPSVNVLVISVPALNDDGLQSRKMYLTFVSLQQKVKLNGAFSPATNITTSSILAPPVISSGDDNADIQQLRVQVRNTVNQIIVGSANSK